MPPVPAPAPFSDADYETIAAAVLETARGRWFLSEHARRNRQADTKLVLEAIEKLERSLAERAEPPPAPAETERVRFDLVDMMNAITRTKAEIAAIQPPGKGNRFSQATNELDSIVETTEKATYDILAAAERVQEIAWSLREQGVDAAVCDLIDAHATEIYTACSFQDITGQRTRKVVDVLRYLEARINSMIRIWRLDGLLTAPGAPAAQGPLVRGPQGAGLQQQAVDELIGHGRRQDVFWRDSDGRTDNDPRNLGNFDLHDLVVFESSPDLDPRIGRNEVQIEPDVVVRDVPRAAPTAPPAKEAKEEPAPSEPAGETLDSLSYAQRFALFG